MTPSRIVPKILVAGRTGAGKSSLLNAILGHAAFQTGVRPTTQGFDAQIWTSPWGQVEVIDSRGFAEADSDASVAGGGSVIQKGYEEAHICLLVIPAGSRDFERESQWVSDAVAAGLFKAIPVFLVVSRVDEVAPVREWNPDSLNLNSPKSPKEINIKAKLDYLNSLAAFEWFFRNNRVLPVSAGQKGEQGTDFDVAPYGIEHVQNRLFEVLPETLKIEYARVFRRLELTRLGVKSLIGSYIRKQFFIGAAFYVLAMVFGAGGAIYGLAAKIFGAVGMNSTVESFLSSSSFLIAFFLILPAPIICQVKMVQEIARRHGLERLNLSLLFSMFRRYPSLFRNFALQPLDWLWLLLTLCCCNPIGFGLFLTRPIAERFNNVFYNFKMNATKEEMEAAFRI